MLATLAYAFVVGMTLGRLKRPVAVKLHDKVLAADADMNKERRYADIYTSRVSNFLYATPYVYLRSPRGSLPHDPALPGGRPANPDPTPGQGG